MPTSAGQELRPVTSLWWLLVLFGAVALGVGLFFVVSPPETLSTFTTIAGIFVLVDGVIAIGSPVFGPREIRGVVDVFGLERSIVGRLLVGKPCETLVVFERVETFWSDAGWI